MDVGIVITMYDECDVVLESIKNIRLSNHNVTIVLIHSDNKETRNILDDVKGLVDYYVLLPNLEDSCDKFELPASVVCRNYSNGFSVLYNLKNSYDLVIGMTADTLITDLNLLIQDLTKTNHMGYVLQAIGQNFNSFDSDPKNGKGGGRFQYENTTDIMPQFFTFKGDVFKNFKMFTNIENTNRFTSEQCLGDEVTKHINNFKTNIKRINKSNYAYSYDEGIKLQIKGLGHTRL